MRKNRITAVLLTLVLLFTSIPVTAVQAEETMSSQKNTVDVTAEATDSFGEMLAETVNGEIEEQEENSGCNIFSVEVEGNIASAEFETDRYATLVIGIYDESGDQMLASGNVEVDPGDTEAEVAIETDAMPEYFYLRGFLVDYETLEPCCTVYESPNYTQEMQEFLAMTTDDFAGREVLNFDDDKTNNFAVYNENTIVVEETEEINEVLQADEDNELYVINNADSEIMGLEEGDLLSYEYADGTLLIIKVTSAAVDGTTVTIHGDDTSMEEVFDYVKIDTTSTMEGAEVDPSTCDEGVTYEGISGKSRAASARAVDIEESVGLTAPFKVNKEIGNFKITGGIELSLKLTVKLYLTLSSQYFEMKFDYSSDFSANFSGKSDLFELPLACFGFTPIPGIIVEVTPSFVGEVSASTELSGTLTGTIGSSVSSDEGVKDLTTKPELDSEIKGEMKVFIGFSLKPRVKVLSKKVVDVSLSGTAGAEASASQKVDMGDSDDYIHDCTNCLDGEISARLGIGFSIKLLNWSKLTFKADRNVCLKITDFYWTVDYGEFAFTTCPHLKYRIDVTVEDSYSNPVASAIVNDEYTTGEDGTVRLYLPDGKYTITAEHAQTGKRSKGITVSEKPRKITLQLRQTAGSGGGIRDVDMSGTHAAAIMDDGSLWMWGSNLYMQLGKSNAGFTLCYTPFKLMDNVKCVSVNAADGLGPVWSAAVTEGGELWLWGTLYREYDSNLHNVYLTEPTKIMDDIESVCLGERECNVIKTDGSLWSWFWPNRPEIIEFTPIKMLDQTAAVAAGDGYTVALKEDGSLWMWGSFSYSFGDGVTTRSDEPVKIMENIKDVEVSKNNDIIAVIKEDGSLWMWGYNPFQIIPYESAQGSREVKIPVKVMDNVAKVSVGYYHAGAIQTDGSLWTWGGSGHGATGHTGSTAIPGKVMDNVVEINMAHEVSAAITADGSLWNWGDGGAVLTRNDGGAEPVNITDLFHTSSAQALQAAFLDTEESEASAIITADSVSTDESGKSTAAFSGLDTEKIYNFYAVKDAEAENILEADNLLYIGQSDELESGTMSVTYLPREQYDSMTVLAAGMTKMTVGTEPEEPEYMRGDVDQNSKVDIADLRLVLRAVCRKVELTEEQENAADVEMDGKVDIVDLRKILRFVCGKIEVL